MRAKLFSWHALRRCEEQGRAKSAVRQIRLTSSAAVTRGDDRALGTPVPGFPQRAAASLRVPGALSLRARARAQGARCKYRAARWGALLRYPTALRGQHSRLHCAPISPAAGRTCPALHCGTDRRRASAGAISIAERSAPRGVPAVPPKPPVLRPPHPKAAAGALVVTFATAARFTRSHIPTPYQVQLVAASARFWRKIGAPRAVRSHPAHCACIARRAPPRTDGNQRAVSTTCRTGRAPFAFQMTNAEACRVAPRLRQYLARGVGFWCRVAAIRFAGVAALAIAELSATEAFAACMSCLLCRGLFPCGFVVFVHDDGAWVQRRCSAGRMMCAQLPLDSQV